MDAQLTRDQQQVAEFRLPAVLDPLKFLREVEVQPLNAHAVADCPSGVEDPLLFGWHPTHAATELILCPQQK